MSMKEKDLAIFVGQKIREYRKKKKLTQKELGEKINKKGNTISNYETGAISPEQDALFALSKVLEVRVDDFFPQDQRPNEENLLQKALEISPNEDLDIETMQLIKTIADKALKLEGPDKKRLMNNIKLALDFYEKSDN